MVLDTWVQCDDRWLRPCARNRRTYHCKDRCARAVDSFAEAALLTFCEFASREKNEKFEFRYAYVYDPEGGVEAMYRVVQGDDGEPYVRRVRRFGDDTQPDEAKVPSERRGAYAEARHLASEWKAREDRFNAMRNGGAK